MPDVDLSVLYREDASFAEVRRTYQYLIDSGQAWLLEGHVGRTAMRLIEDGYCTLGPVGCRDFYGGYIPSRTEVIEGTMGSVGYARRLHPERSDA